MNRGKDSPQGKAVRGPGRPAGGDAAVRAALLQNARSLFLRHGFAAVSTRRIAAAAGTTPAKIHYYFDDKLGLYRAMLEEAMAPLLETLRRMEQSDAPPDLEVLMTQYMRMLAQNRWLPALIVKEVLGEGGQLREQFIEQWASRLAPAFVVVLQRELAQGRLRADVDPQLAAVSALGLCIFPFVSLPITSRVLGLAVDGPGLERLAQHTVQLFRDGVAARGSTS